tara:strand:+ start:2619 stop:2837 length:219 start_codon:yes stop_codon:yes gene_type:complete
MSRLTEYFGWRDIPPLDLNKEWCIHNLHHINIERDDLKRLRKAHLKSIRDNKKEAKKPGNQTQGSMFGNLLN